MLTRWAVRSCSITTLALGLLLPIAPVHAQAPQATPSVAEEAMAAVRLETMLAAGDTGMVIATFRRYPGQTLPFIDSYLEGGLAILEKGDDADGPAAERALTLYRQGIRFAALADEAFGGTSFTRYANSFASWSPAEQRRFREGQRLFRAAMKSVKTADAAASAGASAGSPPPAQSDPRVLQEAIAQLTASERLAQSLGDTWGSAMAAGAMAKLRVRLGGEDLLQAGTDASRAANLNRSMQLKSEWLAALLTLAEASRERSNETRERNTYVEIVQHLDDETISAEVRRRAIASIEAHAERTGQTELSSELSRVKPSLEPLPDPVP